MKALVSPREPVVFDVEVGYRIAEVAQEPFEVAQPLFWVDCPDDCLPDAWYFDTSSQSLVKKPEPPEDHIVEPPTTPVEVLP